MSDNSGVAGDGDIGATVPVVNDAGGNLDVEGNNYIYTEIGELKADKLEGIEEIIWRVDSKIDEIHFTPMSGKNNLKFLYDAMGNRTGKLEMVGQTSIIKEATYYVRDAQGNVMAVYEYGEEMQEDAQVLTYRLSERHIYGSSRLGMDVRRVDYDFDLLNDETTLTRFEPNVYSGDDLVHDLGYKRYELSNHLGNVLSVISDIKVPVEQSGTPGIVAYYQAIILSSQDYSPFGVTLEGRSWNAGYRYGFQNQETDEELWDGAINYKYRVEDPRLGRFFSVDPLVFKYSYNSSYAFQENKFGLGRELEGRELNPFVHLWKEVPVISQSDVDEVMKEVQPVARVATNVVIIAGGVITIGLTAGAAAPAVSASFALLSGSMAVAGGTAKLVLEIANKSDLAEKVPTSYIEGTVCVSIEYIFKGTKYKEEAKVAADVINVTEGVLTLDLKKLGNIEKLTSGDAADLVISSVQIVDDIHSTIKSSQDNLKSQDPAHQKTKHDSEADNSNLEKVDLKVAPAVSTQVVLPKLIKIPKK